MSGTEEVAPAPPVQAVEEEEVCAPPETEAACDSNALSSKSSDISIEEIGPEDNGSSGVEADHNAEVLIAEVGAELAAASGSAPAAEVAEAAAGEASEDKPEVEEVENKDDKEETPPNESGDAQLPPPPPPTAESSSAALAPQGGIPSLAEILDETDDLELDDNDADDDFEDESLVERLIGLTEMFPEGMTTGAVSMAKGSVSGAKWLYGAGRNLTWIVFSTATVLFLPVMIETQLLEIEEAQKQQQRQILLGPGSAMSAGQNAPLPKAPL